ncbi:unnamed protein product [Schistosoma turkestanicum]|nr:unnamed protein product [Schistosoma turkestanicum]
MNQLSTEDNTENNNNNNNLRNTRSNKFSLDNLSSMFKHSELPKQNFADHKINITNQMYSVPLSHHNTINTNSSRIPMEIDQQNNQNAPKLEDILSGISLSTCLESIKIVEKGSNEIKSPTIENTMSKDDENSVVNSKLHSIFHGKSWAQSLFKESVNFYDEYKENPERILDDHFKRIWKTREACMLLEDQIDMYSAFQKHSKKCSKTRRKRDAIKTIPSENDNNIDANLKSSNGNNEMSDLDYDNLQYINNTNNNNEDNVYKSNCNVKLTKQYFSSSKQFPNATSHYSPNHTGSQQNYYICNHCNMYYFAQNNYLDNMTDRIDKEYIPVHSDEITTDYEAFNTLIDAGTKETRNKRIIHQSRSPSYYSCSNESEEYNNNKQHNYFIQTSLSLPDVTNDKQNFPLSDFTISIIYVSEDPLPHVILCENIRWTLKLFKSKVIQQVFANRRKIQTELYNQFQSLRKRFYFKTESNELNSDMIYYEIIDDTEEIPRWRGLIWAKIEIDHNC